LFRAIKPSACFQHADLSASICQYLRRDTATGTRTDYNDVICLIGCHCARHVINVTGPRLEFCQMLEKQEALTDRHASASYIRYDFRAVESNVMVAHERRTMSGEWPGIPNPR
jgi:hypothetical protein